jgi:DNA-binding NarL/FixJ family response regulator
MPTPDPVQPAFYILFGAFMVFAGLHLWRSLKQRISRNDIRSSTSKAFSVDTIDDSQPQSSNRQWHRVTLTPRELQVARLAAEGQRNSEIANELHISILTVETHLKHVYGKLQIRSRTELARMIHDLVD